MKKLVYLGLFVGSTAGGMVPELWGGSAFGGWSLILSLVGGVLGIWAGYRIAQSL